MNAIVLVALRRRLTFVVLAILILLGGVRAVLTTPTDVFPNIGVPVVAAVWTYGGLTPSEMSGRIVFYYERALTTVVSNIEHIESQSLYGFGVVKIFFHPGTDINAAQAQVASISQTVLKQMPPGITPPLMLVYNASSVPVMNLQISAADLTVQQLQDLAQNFIRPALIKVNGAAVPAPYGGAPRYVAVDLDQRKLLAHGLSSTDVTAALARQNIVVPAGDQKIGHVDFLVTTNATPVEVSTFNDMPIRQVGNAITYLRDVAYVHDGAPPQTNIVLVAGRQAVLLPVLKTGNASTLDVVAGVRAMLPGLLRTLPPGVHIDVLNDASVFVRGSVLDVVREMAIAAALTGLLVLVFLGSWRATLIVATSIPLSILSSIIALSLLGQTINVMTLGGLALAVGILVDDATVMIENIAAHLERGQALEPAIIDAANEIVLPTFVSTLCICIVFLPLLTLAGVSGYLFLPLAEAIVFAMIASYILSRTLVPTMAVVLLGREAQRLHRPDAGARRSWFGRLHARFESGFARTRDGYRTLLERAVRRRVPFVLATLAVVAASFALVPWLGRDFFPSVNAGSIAMHMRAPLGTRIEDTATLAMKVEQAIRDILPGRVAGITENIGLPIAGVNLAYSDTGTIGPQDADFTITLRRSDAPAEEYEYLLRKALPARFPGADFAFLPADITDKILNFGLPAAIDVQIVGSDQQGGMAFAQTLLARLRAIPGVADAHVQQALVQPTLQIDANRSFALVTRLTEQDVARNTLMTLSGSAQVAPAFWLDTRTGVSYPINVQTPQPQIDTLNELETTPVSGSAVGGGGSQILGALSTIRQVGAPAVVSHYDIAPVIDIYVGRQVRDLAAVFADVKRVVAGMEADLPRGSRIEMRGQATTLISAYGQLIGGIGVAILLVYLTLVVNFQTWFDPFVILTALPAALAGIVWSLFVSHTPLSVPALTGAIMCMGTATANSILIVSFAREHLAKNGDAGRAAIEAGFARFRPVLMTALAMIVGMIPMSLSNTENAPLGRAVIGGLALATVSTLLFVPAVFAIVHGWRRAGHPQLGGRMEAHS